MIKAPRVSKRSACVAALSPLADLPPSVQRLCMVPRSRLEGSTRGSTARPRHGLLLQGLRLRQAHPLPAPVHDSLQGRARQAARRVRVGHAGRRDRAPHADLCRDEEYGAVRRRSAPRGSTSTARSMCTSLPASDRESPTRSRRSSSSAALRNGGRNSRGNQVNIFRFLTAILRDPVAREPWRMTR